MYMDGIKLLAKNEKESETQIQVVGIYTQDIGMEFGIEKGSILIMKSGKWYMCTIVVLKRLWTPLWHRHSNKLTSVKLC